MRLSSKRTQQEFSLFVGGFRKDLSVEDLINYIKEDIQIIPKSVEINKTNDYNKSFKVTVLYKDKDIMFFPANWEENIILKPFRVQKSNQLSS